MSHWSRMNVELEDQQLLTKTMESLGFTVGGPVEIAEYGWREKLDISLKQNNHLLKFGFKKNSNGNFELQGDFWGTGFSSGKLSNQIRQGYTEQGVYRTMDTQGMFLLEQPAHKQDGTLVIQAARWV